MAAISDFRVTQHSQIFSLFFRNRIQCIALYQLHNSQARFNLRRDYFSFIAETINICYWCLIVIENLIQIPKQRYL